MELKNKKIVFLGDSITEGCGTSCHEARFTERLMQMAELREIKNYGICGTRIARQRVKNPEYIRDTNSYCERFSRMDADADAVVVFGGTNDFGHGDAPFGGDDDRTMDTFCGALHYLMQGLIAKYPTVPIIFLTPLHRDGETEPNESNNLPLVSYVDKIIETAAVYSIPVLDLFRRGGITPSAPMQKELLIPDGLHPNDAGHEILANRIFGFLKAL